MRVKVIGCIILVTISMSCRKDAQLDVAESQFNNEQISVATAKSFFEGSATQQSIGSSSIRSQKVEWKAARSINYKEGNVIAVPIPGQPTIDGVKLGFRKLLFKQDASGQISLNVIEVVPDLVYAWRNRSISGKNFTGQVYIYDSKYKLTKGFIYKNGAVVGLITPRSSKPASTGASVSMVQVIESCSWEQYAYVNSEGIIELVGYKACNYSIYDDGFDPIPERNYPDAGGGGSEVIGGGGGGYTPSEPAYPELVIEAQGEQITLESALSCLGLGLNDNGSFKVTLFADAPVNNDLSSNFNFSTGNPGHTFVQLSATVNGNTSTLSFGFYPFTGTKSTFMDNVSSKTNNDENHEYEASISFNLTLDQIGSLISAYKEAAKNGYDLVKYNCVDFAVNPLNNMGFSIPSATRSVSMYGSMQTPAGLVQGLKNLKSSDPGKYSNIEDSGSKTSPANQGGCDKTF